MHTLVKISTLLLTSGWEWTDCIKSLHAFLNEFWVYNSKIHIKHYKEKKKFISATLFLQPAAVVIHS